MTTRLSVLSSTGDPARKGRLTRCARRKTRFHAPRRRVNEPSPQHRTSGMEFAVASISARRAGAGTERLALRCPLGKQDGDPLREWQPSRAASRCSSSLAGGPCVPGSRARPGSSKVAGCLLAKRSKGGPGSSSGSDPSLLVSWGTSGAACAGREQVARSPMAPRPSRSAPGPLAHGSEAARHRREFPFD